MVMEKHKEKRKISVIIDMDLYYKLWDYMVEKAERGKVHGMMSKVVEDALIRYLEEEERKNSNKE